MLPTGSELVLTDHIMSPRSQLLSIGSLSGLEFFILLQILLLTFKARLTLAPSYTVDMLAPYDRVHSRSSGLRPSGHPEVEA